MKIFPISQTESRACIMSKFLENIQGINVPENRAGSNRDMSSYLAEGAMVLEYQVSHESSSSFGYGTVLYCSCQEGLLVLN